MSGISAAVMDREFDRLSADLSAAVALDAKVYAVPGDKVTCTEGHEICTVAKPLRKGALAAVSLFENWKIRKPEPGDKMSKTKCHCGADFLKGDSRGNPRIFIGGEWRPKLKSEMTATI